MMLRSILLGILVELEVGVMVVRRTVVVVTVLVCVEEKQGVSQVGVGLLCSGWVP
jgi:hypothetical protein